MPPVASTSSNSPASSGVAGLLGVVQENNKGSAGPKATNWSETFKSLLSQLAAEKGQVNALNQEISGETDLSQAEGAIKTILATSGGVTGFASQKEQAIGIDTASTLEIMDAGSLTAEQISQIAALLQQYPALQSILSGNANAETLQSISDEIAKDGKNADFSGLNLTADQQQQLTALAGDDQARSALADIASAAAKDPSAASDIAQMAKTFADRLASVTSPSSTALAEQSSIAKASPATNKTDVSKTGVVTQKKIDTADTENSKDTAESQPVPIDGSVNAKARQIHMAETHSDNELSSTAKDEAPETKSTATAEETKTATASETTSFADTVAATAPETSASTTAAEKPATPAPAQTVSQTAAANYAAAAPAVAVQVAMQMQRNADARNNHFLIQLYPQELGAVQVSLKFDGNGKVQAKITAENSDTLDTLKKDSGDLMTALKNAGLQTDDATLEFSLGQPSQQSAGQSGDDRSLGTKLANKIPDETNIPAARTQQWATLPSSRVDVTL